MAKPPMPTASLSARRQRMPLKTGCESVGAGRTLSMWHDPLTSPPRRMDVETSAKCAVKTERNGLYRNRPDGDRQRRLPTIDTAPSSVFNQEADLKIPRAMRESRAKSAAQRNCFAAIFGRCCGDTPLRRAEKNTVPAWLMAHQRGPTRHADIRLFLVLRRRRGQRIRER